MKDNRKRRRKAHQKGKRAEFVARVWLRLKGYRIMEKRYKTKMGEVDIIARKGSLIAFVEVKARDEVQVALDAISWDSQNRIEAAAERWLQNQSDFGELSWQFDVVAVLPRRLPKHFQNVW